MNSQRLIHMTCIYLYSCSINVVWRPPRSSKKEPHTFRGSDWHPTAWHLRPFWGGWFPLHPKKEAFFFGAFWKVDIDSPRKSIQLSESEKRRKVSKVCAKEVVFCLSRLSTPVSCPGGICEVEHLFTVLKKICKKATQINLGCSNCLYQGLTRRKIWRASSS